MTSMDGSEDKQNINELSKYLSFVTHFGYEKCNWNIVCNLFFNEKKYINVFFFTYCLYSLHSWFNTHTNELNQEKKEIHYDFYCCRGDA